LGITDKPKTKQNRSYTHMGILEKDNNLKINQVDKKSNLMNSSYTQSYTHKNPNEFNGEVLDNQHNTSKNV
jgi:hypothetical protein